MSLGLVIPVRDDSAALNRLLAGAAALGIFDQIIVVDDGSKEPLTCASETVEVIRQESSTGPGPARNHGFDRVKTDHVLFFDSDDLLTPQIASLWQALKRQSFDFCIFRHADTRQIARGQWWQMPHDDALWRLAGMGGKHLAPVSSEAATWLAQTANYPWNKIYRSGFLREAGIRFPDTILHEDVTAHWKSFEAAQTILASDRICATHTVSPSGGRLTNMRGRERIEAIASLHTLGHGLRPPLRLAFHSFMSGLFDWIYHQIDPVWHEDLIAAMGQFWRATLTREDEMRLPEEDPVLALRIALQMSGGKTLRAQKAGWAAC